MMHNDKIKFIIFDLDGIFYRDHDPIDGGKEIINFLENNNIGYCFLTNNSCFALEVYQQKLANCGFHVELEKIITTTTLLISYIKEKKFEDIFVLGSTYLEKELYNNFERCLHNPEALLVGMDDDITLRQISNAINVIGDNTKVIAANPDKLIPKSDGYALECGVIIDIIENISKKEVLVVGKPKAYAFDYVLNTFKVSKKEVLMVGDTYETDIKGALDYGIKAAWINTGNKLPDSILNDDFMRLDTLYSLIKTLK